MHDPKLCCCMCGWLVESRRMPWVWERNRVAVSGGCLGGCT